MITKLYKHMNWPLIEAIIYSESDQPHELLGAHPVSGGVLVQVFEPNALNVSVVVKNDEYKMVMVDEEGFYAALLPKSVKNEYRIKRYLEDGVEEIKDDPYRFKPCIDAADITKFENGVHYEIYNVLGAHLKTINGIEGVHFAVWAPNALRVSVVGDFNHWDGRIHQMSRRLDSGVFEIFIPELKEFELYKFEIKIKGGLTVLKSDPYANYSQLRPDNASVVYKMDCYDWNDQSWMEQRSQLECDKMPMSIYELHLGSFRRPPESSGKQFYNYRELAPLVVSYVKEMGYTHIELMPIMEHPYDESWGYQVIGYYSPTSRYGTPDDLRFFMDQMHQEGIGVIIDWVPAHFPKDAHGLANFDGTCLYEHLDPRKGVHPHWGTLIFNYGRNQVKNYLIANALYWIREFHVDGIRIDAVASMLYLDYGREDGQWIANMYGGKENLEAVEFIKHLNSLVKKEHKGVMMIAEESTAWPGVTKSVQMDGLGFDFKWNMGYMNDYIEYIRKDPYFRFNHHGELTFSMIYAYSERFILAFSHDEVVHGKASMIGKMPGELADQYANLRLSYAYMMFHPGKKLLFMGQDIGQFNEWDSSKEVEWDLLQYKEHQNMKFFYQELNQFYQKNPALYELDYDLEGFEWINSISAQENVLVFLRKSSVDEQFLLVVCNFANVARTAYQVGVPLEGKYKELFNSDAKKYGGSNMQNLRLIASEEKAWDDKEQSITFKMPALSAQVFSYQPFTLEEKIERERLKEEARLKAIEEERIRQLDELEKKLKEEANEAKKNAREAEKIAKEAKKRAVQEAKKADELLKKAKKIADSKELS